MIKKSLQNNKKLNIRTLITHTDGNSIPLVMMVALVVMIVGGAVAYSVVQMFSYTRSESHNQLTYIAAESAIERSICNLDSVITRPNFASSNGITYTNDIDFVDDIISYLNNHEQNLANIWESFEDMNAIKVYGNDTMNKATALLHFEKGGNIISEGNKVTFPIKITATAKMENGIFSSQGKKVVATRKFTVFKPLEFDLAGAVYTIGDLIARSGSSIITGDVYTFGTGLDKMGKMQQYYMGGICAANNATLHIHQGSAFTSSMLRSGMFSEATVNSSQIIVDHDVVAHGIQVFGHNDSIIILRDAYTFDDLEMNGANSYIAINGNYFGLNPGDERYHDTSSAIVNASPVYASGHMGDLMKSRIVINGHILVNGTSFQLDLVSGDMVHKVEDVAFAWNDASGYPKKTIYQKAADALPSPISSTDYFNYLKNLSPSTINGFSVIINGNWANAPEVVGTDDAETINAKANKWLDDDIKACVDPGDYITNHVSIRQEAGEDQITGFCNLAMAANNKIYFMESSNPSARLVRKIPDDSTIDCHIADIIDIPGIDESDEKNYWRQYARYDYVDYTGTSGIRQALENMMSALKGHVQVFAYKDINPDNDNIEYSLVDGTESSSLFMDIVDALEDIPAPANKWIINVTGIEEDEIDVIDELDTKYTIDKYGDGSVIEPYTNFNILVLNTDPEKKLRIKDTFNGIVVSLGKVVVENGATVTGAILAAGEGFDSDSPYQSGSSVDRGVSGTRLPRITFDEHGTPKNASVFESWGYAALELAGGVSEEGDPIPTTIDFSSRDELLDRFRQDTEGILLYDYLDAIF